MERPRDDGRLRWIALLVLGLCAIVAAVAMLPGRAIYGDGNGCFGRALAGLAGTERHGFDCAPSYTALERTEPAGGGSAIGLAVVIAIGAAVLYRRPRPTVAALLWGWCALAAAATVVLSFDLELFARVELLWPAHVLRFALGAIAVLVTAAPLVGIATRAPPRTGPDPSAHASSMGSPRT